MPRCGVTCRPGQWPWIRPISRGGGGCVTRLSTRNPTRPTAPGPAGLRLRPARRPPPRRYRGPAVPPARVRCPNNPVSMRAPHSVPTTSCTPDTPCGHPRLGGVLSPQGRHREPVRRPQTQPPRCAPRLLPGLRTPPLHPARRLHPRRPEHLESARLGHPTGGSRFLGSVPRRTGTRTPTPTAASQHPLRHAPRNISGCHGTGQIATPPRKRNPRIRWSTCLSVESDRLSGTGSPDSPPHSVERRAPRPKKRATQRRMRRNRGSESDPGLIRIRSRANR